MQHFSQIEQRVFHFSAFHCECTYIVQLHSVHIGKYVVRHTYVYNILYVSHCYCCFSLKYIPTLDHHLNHNEAGSPRFMQDSFILLFPKHCSMLGIFCAVCSFLPRDSRWRLLTEGGEVVQVARNSIADAQGVWGSGNAEGSAVLVSGSVCGAPNTSRAALSQTL